MRRGVVRTLHNAAPDSVAVSQRGFRHSLLHCQPSVGNAVAKEDAMGMTAAALALIVLTFVAGCLLWTLLFHFEDFCPAAKDEISNPRAAGMLFLTLTGLTTVGILAVLLLELQHLVSS